MRLQASYYKFKKLVEYQEEIWWKIIKIKEQ